MNTSITDVIKSEYIKIDLESNIRDDAIKELINIEAALSKINNREILLEDVLFRESQFTTNLMDYIAIPHAKSLGVKGAMVLIGKSKEGIEWKSENYIKDNKSKVHLVFLIVVPAESKSNEHLKILALLARCLSREDFRNLLINEYNSTRLYNHIISEVSAKYQSK